ncbi:MAG: hypothetical protein LBM87_02640 [Ruminococcus sp.]|jgi:hypothetical protein|nr:hypothetical protein [Ruminococcus sp.]
MKNQNTGESSACKIARRGFILLLCGPGVLLLAALVGIIGDIPDVLALIIGGIAFILPGIGAVLSIIALTKRKELDKIGRALAIITLVMCNPLFYFIYFFVCLAGGDGFTGLALM